MSKQPTLTVINGGKQGAGPFDLRAWVDEFAARLKEDAPIVLLGCDKDTGRFLMKVNAADESEVLATLGLGAASAVLHMMPNAAGSADVSAQLGDPEETGSGPDHG